MALARMYTTPVVPQMDEQTAAKPVAGHLDPVSTGDLDPPRIIKEGSRGYCCVLNGDEDADCC